MIRLLVDLVPCAPAAGLALEEALFETARAGGEDSLRIWVNDRAVVIGRSQGAASEVDLPAARDLGIPVLRRLSGGGAVYHYPGNLNVSLCLRDGRPLGGVAEAFARLGGTLARGLAAFGPGVTLAENSLLIDRRKVGGAAQARRGASLLYHTTLLVEPDAIPMERLLLALRTGYRPTRVPSRPRPTTTLVEAWDASPIARTSLRRSRMRRAAYSSGPSGGATSLKAKRTVRGTSRARSTGGTSGTCLARGRARHRFPA